MLSQIRRLSVCLSVSRKQLKLGSCSFHHTVVSSLWFLQDKFHPEIPTAFPQVVASNKGGLGEMSYFLSSNSFARWLHKLDLLSQLQCPTSNLIARWRHCHVLTMASAGLSCLNSWRLTHCLAVDEITYWMYLWFVLTVDLLALLFYSYCARVMYVLNLFWRILNGTNNNDSNLYFYIMAFISL